jgi:hypothetical protein
MACAELQSRGLRTFGTEEDIHKICAERFRGANQLRRILNEAQTIADAAMTVFASGKSAEVIPSQESAHFIR